MDWRRLKNLEVATVYVNVYEKVVKGVKAGFVEVVFDNNMADIAKWIKENKPGLYKEDGNYIEIMLEIDKDKPNQQILEMMWEVKSVWDSFLREIVEPVNESLPEVVPVKWEDY